MNRRPPTSSIDAPLPRAGEGICRKVAAASLWLAAHLPRLPLEALLQPPANAAVTDSRGSRRWIIATADNTLAAGLDLGLARVRRPALLALERQPLRERQSLETLACAAYGFGDRISFRVDEAGHDFGLPRFTLWLEIGASLKLFGGLQTLLDKIDREFAALGHSASFGVAPTLEAAAAIARANTRAVATLEELPDALAGLPLSVLTLPTDVLNLLADSGLTHTGEVLALPRDALGKRVGQATMNYLDRLTGAATDARRWYRPPARFARRLNFLDEIEDSERLAFPLRRLLGELACYLRARATGVQRLRLELAHVRADGVDHPPTAIEFNFSAATRDEALMLRVAREKLARATMPAPARSLTLLAEHFAVPTSSQHDLFDTRMHTDEEAAAVIDRLSARLGEQALWRPQCVEDHRPERAWRAAAVYEVTPSTTTLPRARPNFLLRRPQRLQRPPPIVGDVERIESGWWDGADARRDYFVCELERGTRGWAYVDRRDGQIYLHGLWA
ncbi:MAG: polymerase family protein [Nevskia sp.]|nr:polymerase family protein [Nevskia sp.]